MIRAAAKNHADVAVVVSPADYSSLLQQLGQPEDSAGGAQWRRRLAWKAFQHCSTYDAAVAEWLWTQTGALAQVPVKPCLLGPLPGPPRFALCSARLPGRPLLQPLLRRFSAAPCAAGVCVQLLEP